MFGESRDLKWAVIVLFAALVYVDGQTSCTTQGREAGVCVPILACESIIEILNTAPRPLAASTIEFVRSSHCGTFSDVHYVCCEPSRVKRNDTTAVESTSVATTVRASNITASTSGDGSKIRPSVAKSDEDVQAGMTILEGNSCGNSNADRIANGVDAYLSEYPWMALLVYSDGLDRTLNCGGSLITDRYVLTAAHCIAVPNKQLVSVRLGEHDLNEEVDCIGRNQRRRCAPPIQEIDIEEAVYHQDYARRTISNDIGVIRLISKAVFGSNVKPICLPITPQSQTATVSRMIIAGWGRTESTQKANILQKAVVPVREIDYCNQILRSIQLTDKQLCAGGDSNIDACKGDSGGPIFFPARYRRGVRYIQYGIVSAGSVVCGANYPGIYVRVLSYLDWIAGNINP